MEPKKEDNEAKNKNNISYLAIGISLGIIFGTLLNNIGVGIAIGAGLGVALDSSKNKR